MAQLFEHRAAMWEVVSLTPAGPTLRFLGRKCCLCNYICKGLYFLVFSNKEDRPEVPSHGPYSLTQWDVKDLTQRVGDRVPGVVV